MGNKKSCLYKLKSKDLQASPLSVEEILYLMNIFSSSTNDKKRMPLEVYLKNSENRNLDMFVFRCFDKDGDGLMKFKEFKELCEMALRGCIESKLQVLFDVLKLDQEEDGDTLHLSSTKNRMEGFTNHIKNTRKITVIDDKINVDRVDITEDLVAHIFAESDTVNNIEFIQRAFNCPSAIFMLKLIDKNLSAMVEDMDTKLRPHILKLPLMKVLSIEGYYVPKSVLVITDQIKKKMLSKDIDTFSEVYSLDKEDDRNLLESLVNSFLCGYNDLDLSKVSLLILLLALRGVLKSLSSPLFTFILSKKILDENLNEVSKMTSYFKSVFEKLPESNRNLMFCLIKTMNEVYKVINCRYARDSICRLFSRNFFYFDNEIQSLKALPFLEFLFSYSDDVTSSYQSTEIECQKENKSVSYTEFSFSKNDHFFLKKANNSFCN